MRGAIIVIISVALVVWAEGDTKKDSVNTTFTDEALLILEECKNVDISLCFKERALHYLEQLPNNIDLGGIFKVKQTDETIGTKQLNSPQLPEEPRAREDALDTAIFNRMANYLSSLTFEFKLPTETISETKSSTEEESRKKKNKKGMPMMMLFQLKAATIGALALKGVAILAFKALAIAKIALTVAGVIFLKKLFEHKHHSSTYEVVAHPHYEDHGHYDRSFSAEMAYKGYEPGKISSKYKA